MKLKVKFVLIQLVAMTFLSVVLQSVSFNIVTDEMYIRIEETLITAVEGYNGDVNYLRDLGQQIDITVFEGDTRVESSIDGAVGTKASPEVIATVLNEKQTLYEKNVMVNGEAYCGYYKPTDTGMLFAGKPKDVITKLTNNIIAIFTVITLIVVGISMTSSIAIINIIAKRLEAVTACIKQLADKNLNVSIERCDSNTKDETKIISNSLAQLKESLSNIISSINANVDVLNDSTDRFSKDFDVIEENIHNVNFAIEEVAQGATSQAQDTETLAAKANNMSDVVDSSNVETKSLENVVTTMTEISEDAHSALDRLAAVNGKTNESLDTMLQQTNETNKSAEEIKKTVLFIQDIASQTNLLSLNANIEAARAGDAGRGFSVVAEEIRKLADDVAKSAKDTAVIVDSLLTNVDRSVELMEVLTEDSQKQKEDLEGTQVLFNSLEEEIKKVLSATSGITNQMELLSTIRNSISDATSSLSAISEENAASTEETSASMQTLSSIVTDCNDGIANIATSSKDLMKLISEFKI